MKLSTKDKSHSCCGVQSSDVASKLHTDVDGIFDRFLRGDWSAPLSLFGAQGSWGPSVDVVDGQREVVVKADLPGVEAKELDISLAGNLLTISGERKGVHEEKGKGFYHSERRVGSFHRSVELPSSVDSEKVTADYKNGVLTIRLEKLESEKPRKITVR